MIQPENPNRVLGSALTLLFLLPFWLMLYSPGHSPLVTPGHGLRSAPFGSPWGGTRGATLQILKGEPSVGVPAVMDLEPQANPQTNVHVLPHVRWV